MPGRATRRRRRRRSTSPIRPWWFRALVIGAVATLLAMTGLAVRAALQPAPPPPAPAVAPQTGALAVVGPDHAWRAVNVDPCQSGVPTVPVERLDDGRWVAAATPLVQVGQLAFSSPSVGVAVGLDADCRPAYAVTSDGGATWQAGSPARPLISASAGGAVLWGLDASSTGQPRLLLLSPDGSAARGSSQEVPCSQADGPPSLLAAVDATYGLALCEGPSGEGRLLLRTSSAGRYWDRLTDARPLTGFDLLGKLRSLTFPDRTHGFALGDAADCAAGQVRASVDSGQTWKPLPCLTSLTSVLSVAFWTDTSGLLLGRTGSTTVVLRTADGGHTWSPMRAAGTA